ncbi:MAG TPA: hypothetical protein VF782_09725 [Allosphingosinicella sp.]|jgi:hypothetical protein
MPVSDENLPLYESLQEKRWQLYLYSKRLFEYRDAATQFVIDPERAEVTLELILIDGFMTDLNHNNPINFPSQAQFEALMADVAILRGAIESGASLSDLMGAGGAVLAAWPN